MRKSRGSRLLARIGLTSIVAACAMWASSISLAQQENTVLRMRLDGVVDPFIADHLRRGVEAAADQGAAAVLIEIDTPGGLVSATREITGAILNAEVPVLTYVAPAGARAASAGSFVLLSGNVAAMAPGTNVGAATPVGLSGAVANDKAVNDAEASIKAIAQERGRNPEVAASFVTEATSLTAEEALNKGVIDLIAMSSRELLRQVDGMEVELASGEMVTLHTSEVKIVDRSMSPGLGLLHSLLDPNLAFLFFWLGLGLIVLELLVPGHIFSGTIGTILLILSIASFGLLPVRLIGILLLVASIVFFLIELNAPGFGIWGIAATVCLILGGLLLYQPASGVRVSPFVLVPVAAAAALFFGVVVAKVMRIRQLPPAQGPEAIVGREGVVLGTAVDQNGGVVRVAAEEWRAVTPTGRLEPGTKIKVTGLKGLVLTVQPVDRTHASTGAQATAEEGGTS